MADIVESSGRPNKVKHIVADSVAFLKNVPLHEISENVYTIEDVVKEIKDSATRQRLSILPYSVQFRQPSSDAIHTVSEFAKLTGDFRSLSAVDILVLALTYQLEKEHCGTEHIRSKPTGQVEITQEFHGKKVPGFFVQKTQETHVQGETIRNKCEHLRSVGDCKERITSEQNQNQALADIETGVENIVIGQSIQRNTKEECSKGEDEGFDENDDGDNSGWITPDNLRHAREQMGQATLHPFSGVVTVGCLTTDFAMQNVLIQMGLHVISVDGMLIKETQSYVLKCYGCYRVTRQLGKVFCPSCGNNTLWKLVANVDENGVTHYHIPKRKKPFNIRGKKYPLPLPKSGRHGDEPVLTEDQRRSHHRLPRKKDHADVFDPDYIARTSPFASNDVTSRALQLGYHLKRDYQTRRNPNEVRKKSGRRKK